MDESAKVERLTKIAMDSPIAMQCLSSHQVCQKVAPLERLADVDECVMDALEYTTATLANYAHMLQGNPFVPADFPVALPTPGKSCKSDGKNYKRPSLKDTAWERVGLVFGYIGDVLGDDCVLTRERNAIIFSRPSTGQDYTLDLSTFAASMSPARAIAAQIARALTESPRPPR